MPTLRLRGWATSSDQQVVPISVGRAMVERAKRFDVEAGGRFEVRYDRSVILWRRGGASHH